jgi:hypothetical protein
MLRKHTAVLGVASAFLVFSACQRSLSSNEAKVVGTWDRTGMDATERTTFRPDHTMESEMSDGNGTQPFASGTWRVEGNILVTEFHVKLDPIAGETPLQKQIVRDPIIEFQKDKLVRGEGRPPLVRAK